MTTIAYKDGVLAADTGSWRGSNFDGDAVKIAKRGPVLAAESGDAAMGTAFLDWFRGGMKGEPPPASKGDDIASGVLFHGKNVVAWDRNGWTVSRSNFYAMGSGAEVAKGAMAAGASADEAVLIAGEHDAWTRGLMVLRA